MTGDPSRSRPTLVDLRALVGEIGTSASREELSFSLLESFGGFGAGLPRGSICEFSGPAGSGKTEVVLRFLAEHPRLRLVWIEDVFTVFPVAFCQQGVELTRVLFVEAGAESIWTALQVLRSGLFSVMILSLKKTPIDERGLRRLQMAAEKSAAVVILLSAQRIVRGSWPIAFQAEVMRRAKNLPEIQVVKWRRVKPWNARISNQIRNQTFFDCMDPNEARKGRFTSKIA